MITVVLASLALSTLFAQNQLVPDGGMVRTR